MRRLRITSNTLGAPNWRKRCAAGCRLAWATARPANEAAYAVGKMLLLDDAVVRVIQQHGRVGKVIQGDGEFGVVGEEIGTVESQKVQDAGQFHFALFDHPFRVKFQWRALFLLWW